MYSFFIHIIFLEFDRVDWGWVGVAVVVPLINFLFLCSDRLAETGKVQFFRSGSGSDSLAEIGKVQCQSVSSRGMGSDDDWGK